MSTTMYLHNAASATDTQLDILSGKSLIIDSGASLVIDPSATFTYKGTEITVTAAELNILDGSYWDSQAYTTIAVEADDRVVYNDGGTMKQIKMSDIRSFCAGSTEIGSGTGALAIGTASESITLGTSSTPILHGTTNVTQSAQRAEIIPCNSSTFGTTLAPIVMSSTQINKHYDGWYFKNISITHSDNSTSVGTGSWVTRPLDSAWTIADIQYIQLGFMPLTGGKSPKIIVTVSDSGTTKKYKYSTSTITNEDNKYALLVKLTGTSTPLNIPGHNVLSLDTPTQTDLINSGTFHSDTTIPTSSATITNIELSMDGSVANDTEIIIHECNWVTSVQGTISFKFTNDSVVQAQSAQAVAALYAALYKQSVSQTASDILSTISGVADYTGTIAATVYGNTKVLANYVPQP